MAEFLSPDHLFGLPGPDDIASSMLAFASNKFAGTHCTPGTPGTMGQHGWTPGLSLHGVGVKRLCCCRAIVATVEVSPRGARFSFERATNAGEVVRYCAPAVAACCWTIPSNSSGVVGLARIAVNVPGSRLLNMSALPEYAMTFTRQVEGLSLKSRAV